MKKYFYNTEWTERKVQQLVDTMRHGADNIYENKGFWCSSRLSRNQRGFHPSVYWQALSNEIKSSVVNSKDREVKGSIPNINFGQTINNFFRSMGEEGKKMDWNHAGDREEEINCVSVAQSLNLLKHNAMISGNTQYRDTIDFINYVDLNSATVKLVETVGNNSDNIIENRIDSAIQNIERSFDNSGKNSNISGDMYRSLLEVKENINRLRTNTDDNERAAVKARLALSLDKMDNTARKYLDYKASTSIRDTALGKVRAAFQIVEITQFCYGMTKDIPEMDRVNDNTLKTKFAEFKTKNDKIDKTDQDYCGCRESRFATERNKFEIMSKTASYDYSLRTQIEARRHPQQPNAARHRAL